MKKALVIGARQALGFQICEQLLENGYSVYGKDFASWQDEEHDEKWMFIGRNANLHYDHVDDKGIAENGNMDYVIIPLTDFYNRNYPSVHQQLLTELQTLSTAKSFANSTIILLQPTAINARDSQFSDEIEKIKTKNNKVIEYYISIKNQRITETLYYNSTNKCGEWKNHDLQNEEDIAQFLIQELK